LVEEPRKNEENLSIWSQSTWKNKRNSLYFYLDKRHESSSLPSQLIWHSQCAKCTPWVHGPTIGVGPCTHYVHFSQRKCHIWVGYVTYKTHKPSTLIMLISVVYTNFLLKAITSYAKWIFLPRAKLLMLLKKNDFYTRGVHSM
jgi:hypothetical protein